MPVGLLAQDAIPGSRTHGYVTGTTDYGVFVGFYGGLKGLIPAKDLDQKPQDTFEIGQVQFMYTLAFGSSRGNHACLRKLLILCLSLRMSFVL